MSRKEELKTLRDLQKKGFVIPGVNAKGAAKIPAMPATVECPHCGERIPVYVQIRNLSFAVSYPVRKEVAGR